jgi:type II secretion system protein H
MRRAPTNRHGFTLVELMVLIGIVGLIASIAVPSFNSYLRANRIDVVGDQMSSDLALARAVAVSEGRVVRMVADSEGYAIVDPATDRQIRQRDFPDDVHLTAPVTINFFPWGAAQSATMVLDNGRQQRTVQVLPTGIVEVGS